MVDKNVSHNKTQVTSFCLLETCALGHLGAGERAGENCQGLSRLSGQGPAIPPLSRLCGHTASGSSVLLSGLSCPGTQLPRCPSLHSTHSHPWEQFIQRDPVTAQTQQRLESPTRELDTRRFLDREFKVPQRGCGQPPCPSGLSVASCVTLLLCSSLAWWGRGRRGGTLRPRCLGISPNRALKLWHPTSSLLTSLPASSSAGPTPPRLLTHTLVTVTPLPHHHLPSEKRISLKFSSAWTPGTKHHPR